MNNRLDQLLDMIKQNSKDTFLHFAVGREYYNIGNLDSAIDYYKKAIELDVKYIGAYFHLGIAYQESGNYEKAALILSQGIEVAKAENDMRSLNEMNAILEELE